MSDNDPRSRPRLGFIGLGGMGGRMARRLLAAGYDLTVHDRARERARPLEQGGAKFAPTSKQVAAAADLVLSSLTDDAAVEATMFGPEGALAGARPGTIFIEMSTVSPRTSRQLHEAGTTGGLVVLDAPVSGSTPQAEEGELVIVVGGEEDGYRKSRPILSVLGKESFYMGPAGSGTATKRKEARTATPSSGRCKKGLGWRRERQEPRWPRDRTRRGYRPPSLGDPPSRQRRVTSIVAIIPLSSWANRWQ